MIRSTRQSQVADYLGADLTDGTPGRRRPIDVCGLISVGASFRALFWTWEWSVQGFESVISELRSARCTFIDGPQGFASRGRTMRGCDRAASAAASEGKVPGFSVVLLGESLVVRPSGELEEGPTASLEVDERLRLVLAGVAGPARSPAAHMSSKVAAAAGTRTSRA